MLAFSLIEILVALALLSFIVVALFIVFNHVQRAFRASMNQTDLFEAGRIVNDSLAREIEQLTPSGRNAMNFYAQLLNEQPVIQSLPGGNQIRTNFLEDFFMLIRDNNGWTGIGYCVRTNDSQGRLWLPEVSAGKAGVGSLYRFNYTMPYLYTNGASVGLPQDPGNIFSNFLFASQPGSSLISNRVCDGVIHFRFRTFDTNGWPMIQNSRFSTDIQTNSTVAFGEVWRYSFISNAVPAFVETELGLLEPRAVSRFFSIGDPTAQLNYLKRDDITSRVQLFRQRIAVRNIDPSAFQ